jgi:hypothetical protein
MSPVGFETKISADKLPQIYALDRVAIGTGSHKSSYVFYDGMTYTQLPKLKIF